MLDSDVSLISKYISTRIGYSSLFVRVTGEESALVNYHEIKILSS